MATSDRLAVVGLASTTILLFRDAVFGGRVFYERDVQLMWYSQAEAFVQSILSGCWPVWNRWAGFGQPLWADANNQVLYPLTWLHLILRPWTVYTLQVVLHSWFSGIGMLFLARRLGISSGGAFVGALLWIAGGPYLSLVPMGNQLAGASWIPWTVVAGIAALDSLRPLPTLAWGVTVAAPVLAGAPEAALMGVAILALFAAGAPKVDQSTRRKQLRHLALGVSFAIGLSAGQWLPAWDVASRSARQALPAEVRSYWSIHPLNLLQTIWPLPLHELPLPPEWRAEMFESRDPFLRSLYLGLPALPLVMLALAANRRRNWGLAALGLLAALLALGRHAPVHDLLLVLVPPLKAFRYPAKAMVVAGFCWALLAGFGFDRVMERRSKLIPLSLAALAAGAGTIALVLRSASEDPIYRISAERMSVACIGGLLIAIVLSYPRMISPASTRWILVVGIVGELLIAHDGLNRTAPRELFSYRPDVLEHLAMENHSRLYTYDYYVPGKSLRYLGRDAAYRVVRGPAGWDPRAASALGLRMYLFPPSAGVWGVEGSFDKDVSGLAPLQLDRFCALLLAREGTPSHQRLLQLGAVSHVIALHRAGFDGLPLAGAVPGFFPEPTLVFRLPDALPRAYAVGRSRGASDVSALLDPGFEPTNEILVPSGPARAEASDFSGTVAIVSIRPDRFTLRADLAAPGYVVLVNAYDPGWQVLVDGQASPILAANLVFCGVAVERGSHSIEFLYRPGSVFWGLGISGVSLVAGLIAAGVISRM